MKTVAICSKYKIAYFPLATLQGFGWRERILLSGEIRLWTWPNVKTWLWVGKTFFKIIYLSHQFGNWLKIFALLTGFLLSSLLLMFIPILAAPIGWFNGTKGLRSVAVQKKKHSLTGTGKAICNHNSSYLLIFYLKHSDVNSTVPCQPPWGKVHFETKTNFLHAGKSDLRHGDNVL